MISALRSNDFWSSDKTQWVMLFHTMPESHRPKPRYTTLISHHYAFVTSSAIQFCSSIYEPKGASRSYPTSHRFLLSAKLILSILNRLSNYPTNICRTTYRFPQNPPHQPLSLPQPCATKSSTTTAATPAAATSTTPSTSLSSASAPKKPVVSVRGTQVSGAKCIVPAASAASAKYTPSGMGLKTVGG